MLAKVYSCAVLGLDGQTIEVEIDKGGGVSKIIMVGLPDTAVQEVARAGAGSDSRRGPELSDGRLHGQPRACHLPTRPGLRSAHRRGQALAATHQLPLDALDNAVFIGELALDGNLRHVNGILPMADFARRQGFQKLYVPEVDAAEAALVEGIEVIPVDHLSHLVNHLLALCPSRLNYGLCH